MITKISAHGKGDNGYILLDVLVGLLVAMIGFGALFGAINTAVNYTVKRNNRSLKDIESRNEEAYEFEKIITFQ